MNATNYPRLVVSGLSGDSGKTMVSCGLLSAFRSKGLSVCAFKKGPDYIDAAWLSLASGKPARNLDTYLMGFAGARRSFIESAFQDGINVIEGNRGLFDGVDTSGTHSTAELAKLLKAPVIMTLNISKVTRTAAAEILGCMRLDPDLNIAGVILNRAANHRHGYVVKEAIEEVTGLPVLGVIPKLSSEAILPSRHLGLITPDEFELSEIVMREAGKAVDDNVDVPAIIEIANRFADQLEQSKPHTAGTSMQSSSHRAMEDYPTRMRMGYFKDRSFSFYYPENLEMLEAAGMELISISPSHDVLPDHLDALYIGGGFPEMNLPSLISNQEMMKAVREAADDGLPIYAECGGLVYLAKCLEWNEKKYDLAGVLPIVVRMREKPQGHGYCEAVVDRENPFFKLGVTIRGHEFHYSSICLHDPEIRSSLSLTRGVGSFDRRDGLTYKNVFASYVHIHALATPQWVDGIVECAAEYVKLNNEKNLAVSVEGK